jgi:hypothetical protein
MNLADERIRHVVVLMMKNRSFDNMPGHLTVDGRKDVDGVTDRRSNEHNDRTYRVRPAKKDEAVKTLLEQFCRRPDGKIPHMTRRVMPWRVSCRVELGRVLRVLSESADGVAMEE